MQDTPPMAGPRRAASGICGVLRLVSWFQEERARGGRERKRPGAFGALRRGLWRPVRVRGASGPRRKHADARSEPLSNMRRDTAEARRSRRHKSRTACCATPTSKTG
eukprot:1553757-Rhodomonas_salina.2